MPNTDTRLAAVPSVLKHHNRELVLSCFRDNQEHSVADIVKSTGISKLTVMRAIQFFCGKGILISSGKGESTEQGGKKPEYFRFGYKKYLLTVMMWPEMLGLTLFDMSLRQVCRRSLEWIIPASPEQAFDFVRRNAAELMDEAGIEASDLYGVSLSTSGIVDYDSLVLKYSVHSPEWGTDIPVGDYLRDIFGEGVYFFVENAGKCISRSILAGQPDPEKRIMVLFTSWGLSGAMIEGGRILNGRDSLIGEIGHMILDPTDSEQCSCGGYGCLERLVSIARLRKQLAANPAPHSSPLSKLAPEAVSLHHIFFASQQQDDYARDYVGYLAGCFATLLRNVSLVFNPETVVFVGDYASADEYFDRCMRRQLDQFHYLTSGSAIEIIYDKRPLPDLDAKGGAVALLDSFFSREELYED